MRIVHVANFNTFKYGATYYAPDRKLSNGLIRNGHFVHDFSYRDICRSESPFKTTKLGTTKLNRRLVETCQAIKPDLMLLGHSELITAETLKTIKSAHENMKIAMWYVDPLFHSDQTTHIFNRLEWVDTFFATTGGEELKKFSRPHNKVAYFPNPVDPSIDSYRNFDSSNLEYDFIFCGRDYGEPERKRFLSGLFGELEKNIRCEVRGALNNPLVFGHAFMELLSKSKMGLNYSRRNDVYLYSSDRIAQLTGNGLLSFSPQIPGFSSLYNDSELVYFDGLEELIEKVNYYHNHDDQRKTIAHNGWKRAHNSYNSRRITAFMLELIFEQSFSEQYEWVEEVY